MEFLNNNFIDGQDKQNFFSSLLNAAEVSLMLPSKKSTCTIIRWMRHGLISRSGQKVRLRHVRMGDTLFTSENWLMNFFTELAESDCDYFGNTNNKSTSKDTTSTSRSQTRKQKDIAIADSYLDSKGI